MYLQRAQMRSQRRPARAKLQQALQAISFLDFSLEWLSKRRPNQQLILRVLRYPNKVQMKKQKNRVHHLCLDCLRDLTQWARHSRRKSLMQSPLSQLRRLLKRKLSTLLNSLLIFSASWIWWHRKLHKRKTRPHHPIRKTLYRKIPIHLA